MAIRTLRRASINDDQKFWSLARAAAVTTTSGLLQIVPQSIAFTGTSASIVGNGQVAFSAVSSLSVNGVFTSEYRNYVVILRDVLTTSTSGFSMRLRAAGTDASAANYAYQHLEASSTVITGGRGTSQTAFALAVYSTQRDGIAMQLYAPALAQSTAMRATSAYSFTSAYIFDTANTHSLATAYDGFTLFTAASSVTGALQIYGVRS